MSLLKYKNIIYTITEIFKVKYGDTYLHSQSLEGADSRVRGSRPSLDPHGLPDHAQLHVIQPQKQNKPR